LVPDAAPSIAIMQTLAKRGAGSIGTKEQFPWSRRGLSFKRPCLGVLVGRRGWDPQSRFLGSFAIQHPVHVGADSTQTAPPAGRGDGPSRRKVTVPKTLSTGGRPWGRAQIRHHGPGYPRSPGAITHRWAAAKGRLCGWVRVRPWLTPRTASCDVIKPVCRNPRGARRIEWCFPAPRGSGNAFPFNHW